MKNLKNMAILLALVCMAPVCCADVSRNIEMNRARTKLALGETAMIYGAYTGIITGVITQSALAGGAVCAVPIVVYSYLRAKYKSMFTKKEFDRVNDTDDETFYYTMMPFTPFVYVGMPIVLALPGTITGVGLGLPAVCTVAFGAASFKIALAALTTYGRQYSEPNRTWGETLTNFKNHLIYMGDSISEKAISGTIFTIAALGGMIVAQDLFKQGLIKS